MLRSFRGRLFLWSRFWRRPDMLWMNIFLSIFFIWWYWRKWCSRRLLIAWISRSNCAVLFLFWPIFINYCLCLFLLILVFDNNLDLLFWRNTKSFSFNFFPLTWLFRIINWLSFIAQITIVLHLLELNGTATSLHFVRLWLKASLSWDNVPVSTITGFNILSSTNRIFLNSPPHNIWRLVFILMIIIIFFAVSQYLLLLYFNRIIFILKLSIFFFFIEWIIINWSQPWVLLLLCLWIANFLLRRSVLAVRSLRCYIGHVVLGLCVRWWQHVLFSLVSASTLQNWHINI